MWRYIDDIFFIWERVQEPLQEFINEINSFHPQSNLRQTDQKKKKYFLDIEVTIQNGILSTDLTVKPTETYQFLDPASCCPDHCKKGIPYSQTLSVRGFAPIIVILINDVKSWTVDYLKKVTVKKW